MARALSTSAAFSKTLLSVSFLAPRRGFAAAAETAVSVRRSPTADDKAAAAVAVAQLFAHPDPWVPDPVTGYYRPSNRVVDVDAAELRAMLLRPKP
ncbi:hypothetical protein LUZ63_008804 [Rhynchospora breviuscula]|uniref:Uncharacterized protein n=1 Tax=Rhynchospora breviuscula TaxID=2022672 RepID=A0A9Q0CDW8_9POAL|nr:hypothetical protein LUZ63_008804 [Rhynchospora breviuscula]